MRTSLFAATMLALTLAPPISAEEGETITVPAESKFFVHININAFRKTDIGGRLFEMAKREALQELSEKDGDENFEKMKEALGFDPFTELDAITVVGANFKKPEDSLHVIFRLKKTTGNLEGLMVSLPDYSSSEYGDHVIHSASDGEDEQAFGAIHSDRKGVKRIVAARSADRVKGLLDMLDGKKNRDSKAVKLSKSDGQFVHVELLDIPRDEIGEGPQANVAKMIEGISLKIGNDGDDVSISLTLKTKEERQAKQLKQMVQGLTAMLQLVQDDDGDDDLRQAKEFLERMVIKRDGNEIRIRLSVPESEVAELIEEGMLEL